MTARNVFVYWAGKEYTLIPILRNLIYLHSTHGKGYKVHVIKENNIHEYIDNIPYCFETLSPSQQAYFVKVNVLCDRGGIWLDSDTLVLESLDTLFDIIENKHGFFIKQNKTPMLCSKIVGSQKQTSLLLEWRNQFNQLLESEKEKMEWMEIDNMLQNIYDSYPGLYKQYEIFDGKYSLYPVDREHCVDEFLEKPYDNYKNMVHEYQPLLVLTNTVYKELEEKSQKDILDANMPLNYFIKKSFKNICQHKMFTRDDSNEPLPLPHSVPESSLEKTPKEEIQSYIRAELNSRAKSEKKVEKKQKDLPFFNDTVVYRKKVNSLRRMQFNGNMPFSEKKTDTFIQDISFRVKIR
jgi:hypothetical protein